MLLYSLLTGIVIIAELLLCYLFSWKITVQYHDVLFLFGAFISAFIWFFSSKGKNAEIGLSYDLYTCIGSFFKMNFIAEEKYSIKINPFFVGSIIVMIIGIVLSLIIYF